MVIVTDAGLLCTFSDLGPEGEQQNPNAGQPHEDTSVEKKNGGRKNQKEKKKLMSRDSCPRLERRLVL